MHLPNRDCCGLLTMEKAEGEQSLPPTAWGCPSSMLRPTTTSDWLAAMFHVKRVFRERPWAQVRLD